MEGERERGQSNEYRERQESSNRVSMAVMTQTIRNCRGTDSYRTKIRRLSCNSIRPRKHNHGALILRASARLVSGYTSDDTWITCFGSGDARPIILFDGVCNMCNGGVNFVLDWDYEGKLRMAALQSDVGKKLLKICGRSPDDISSIVLVQESNFCIKSEAILKIGELLDVPLPAISSLLMYVPTIVRDPTYDLIAANRYSVFGRTSECRMKDNRYEERFL